MTGLVYLEAPAYLSYRSKISRSFKKYLVQIISRVFKNMLIVQKYLECSKVTCGQKYLQKYLLFKNMSVQKYLVFKNIICSKVRVSKNILCSKKYHECSKYLECSKMSWVFKDVLFSILQRDWHTSSDSVYWYTPHLCTLMHSYGVYWHLAKNSVQSGARGRPSWT